MKCVIGVLALCLLSFASFAYGATPAPVTTVEFPIDNETLCAGCILIVSAAQSFIQKNTSIAEIEAFLEKTVCKFMPTNQEMCKAIVRDYVPLIVQIVINKVNPQVGCKLIKLCQ